MKICIFAFLLFALAGCGGAPQVVIPPDADLKADVMMQGAGKTRKVEITFYFSKPTAPGVKTEPTIDVIPVEEVQFNGEALTAEAGRNIYTGQNIQIKPENVISAKLNGKPYEGRAVPQTTLQNKSVTAVMVPK